MENRFCLICDKEFTPRSHEDEFCSQECMADYDEYVTEEWWDDDNAQ